jgi:uncharacterized protein
MSNYYIDTSALAKRYLSEIGSNWITTLVDPTAGNVIVICDLTPVEFFSTVARRQREGTVTPSNALILQTRFLADVEREYLSVPLESMVLSRARDLLTRHPLRSLDSVQLASAIEAVNILSEPMTFISADNNLLSAAALEGFGTDNPNNHP